MEEEVNKAINTTVFKEYGDPDHSKVTKAINFAQENVSIISSINACQKLLERIVLNNVMLKLYIKFQ